MTAPASDATSDSMGGLLTTATVLTFVRPTAWFVALAGFLARGGILLVLAPIVIVPSTASLTTLFGPLVNRLLLGTIDPLIIGASLGLLLVISLVIVALLLVGGAVDGWLIGVAAGELEVAVDPASDPTASRLAAARVIGHLPLVIAIALALEPVAAATVREFQSPGDLSTPVAVRVIARSPLPVAVVIAALVTSDALAALAVRAVALSGASLWGSVPRGLRIAARRPVDALVALFGSVLISVVLVVPAVLASSAAFGGLARFAGGDPADLALVGASLLLVASWLGSLLLAAVAATWRSFIWTTVHARAVALG